SRPRNAGGTEVPRHSCSTGLSSRPKCRAIRARPGCHPDRSAALYAARSGGIVAHSHRTSALWVLNSRTFNSPTSSPLPLRLLCSLCALCVPISVTSVLPSLFAFLFSFLCALCVPISVTSVLPSLFAFLFSFLCALCVPISVTSVLPSLFAV